MHHSLENVYGEIVLFHLVNVVEVLAFKFTGLENMIYFVGF